MTRTRMGLASQLGLLLVLPIALTFIAYGTLSQQRRHQALLAEASAELRNHAMLVEAAVGGAVERGQVQLLKDRLERIARADRILGIAAFDARGGPILVTDHLDEGKSRLGQLAKRAADGGVDFEETADLGGAPTLIRTVTLSAKMGGPVVAVVARDLGYVEKLNASLNRGLAVTGVALLFAALGLVMILTRATVARPARAIVAGAERIASGDLATTVPETGAEELARLARAFNTMTRSLGDARSRAEQEVSRRLAEEAGRVAAERRLQHARALAAVGRVAASIAHEIGSPLGVILGRARLLADQPNCTADVKGDLETIAEQSERISRVVARLLAVARTPEAAGRWSDARRVARDVLQFLGPECRQRRIDARVEASAGELRVGLDGDQLFQVLFNLCWNAIEAQPEGGQLLIRAAREGGRVTLEVVDSGPGVPPEVADRIFAPFFTTKADRSGSGLGLDIVSGIVQEVGGSVRLAETPVRGACFLVTLPIAASAIEGAEAVEQATPMSQTQLLVVDDEPEMSKLVADIARKQGHAARSLTEPSLAMAMIEAEPFDLVVTDVRMPGIDGIELIARIHAYDPRIAVIAITAFGTIDTAVRAMRAGAFDYLPKPFTPAEMALRIENALARRALSVELSELRSEMSDKFKVAGLVGRSRALQDVADLVRRVADVPSTVLITGPSGSGKELVARALHTESRRRARKFVAVNCAAIPESLMESELFGVKKGAYTDARSDRLGMFREADGGTLFLDEIGELALPLQAKLLRALQEGEVRPVGASSAERVDVRIVAATNRDPRTAVAEGRFREDLFYRLAVIEIAIPALRHRPDDILPLAEHFLRRASGQLGKHLAGFSGAAVKRLLAHDWPGNVRELENAIERAAALCDADRVSPDDLPDTTRSTSAPDFLQQAAERMMTLAELERAYAQRVLEKVGGNKLRAASLLGVDRRTLQRWFGEPASQGEGG